MTTEELEQKMFQTCNVTIAGTYTIFHTLKGKLCQLAQIHANEEKIELLKALKATGYIGAGAADYFIEQLNEQHKNLQDDI